MNFTISSFLLLSTNLALTILSIYWSISAWKTLNNARNEKTWTESACTIQGTSIKSRPLQNSRFLYCPVVTVAINLPSNTSPSSTSTITVNITSSTYLPSEFSQDNEYEDDPDAKCSSNSTNVDQYLNKNFNDNDIVKCWISPSSPNEISLVDVVTGVHKQHVNLAAISTVLAIAAVLSLGAITFLLFMPHPAYVIPEVLAQPSSIARAGLTREDVDAIIEVAEEADKNCYGVASEDRMCAICLEDGLGARLPCNHAYHPTCIKKWLLRGAETCPLCLAVVSVPGSPSSCNGDSQTETSSTTTTTRSVSPSNVANAGSTGDNETHHIDSLPIAQAVHSVYDPSNSPGSLRHLPIGRRTFVARLPPSFGPPTVIHLPAPPGITTLRNIQERGSITWRRLGPLNTSSQLGAERRNINEENNLRLNDDAVQVPQDDLDDIDVSILNSDEHLIFNVPNTTSEQRGITQMESASLESTSSRPEDNHIVATISENENLTTTNGEDIISHTTPDNLQTNNSMFYDDDDTKDNDNEKQNAQ